MQNIARAMRDNDSDILLDYRNRWNTFRVGVMYLHNLFRYLNQHWIRKTLDDGRNKLGGLFQEAGAARDVHEVYLLGLLLWKQHVFDQLRERVVKRLLEVVARDREGEGAATMAAPGQKVSRADDNGEEQCCVAVVESLVSMGIANKVVRSFSSSIFRFCSV